MEKNDILARIGELQNEGILRWKRDITVDDALDIVMAIGKKNYTEDFVIDSANEYVYRNVIKWIHGDSSMQAVNPITRKPESGRLKAGIYIAGGTGTGKSVCLNVLRDYSQLIRPTIQFLPDDYTNLLIWKSYNASYITAEYLRIGNTSEIEDKKLLCIQDLGCEPTDVVYMGNRVNVIKSIIERRGDKNNRMLLVTSNISMDDTQKKYGDRVASRLHQMCNYFILQGKDRRY